MIAEHVETLEVGSRHLVTLHREITLDSLTGEPRTKYRTLGINRPRRQLSIDMLIFNLTDV